MKDNRNYSSSVAADQSFMHHTALLPSPKKNQAKKHFEVNSGLVSKIQKDNDKLNRRYSFDDNGGGYLGL